LPPREVLKLAREALARGAEHPHDPAQESMQEPTHDAL
jgi:hypothetical protein